MVAWIRRKAPAYDGHSECSQAVLLALQEGLGIGDAESSRSATVLSGGIARRGESCGALLGALMELGLVAGREQMADRPSYVRATGIADEICDGIQEKLREEFGFDEHLASTIWREIQEKRSTGALSTSGSGKTMRPSSRRVDTATRDDTRCAE